MANHHSATATYLDFYGSESLVEENVFLTAEPDLSSPPTFAEARELLPSPFWDGHQSAIDCYWRAWELAFSNLRPATTGNGFVAPFIDPSFNGSLLMWDSAFMLLFGHYGARAFNFQRTLDNFYAKQHGDGFICREIREEDGRDQFHRHDPVAAGPNLLPWCEAEYFRNSGDRERLAKVFSPLLSFHRWMRRHRSWPDGGYWSCGLASGMDNQPRVSRVYDGLIDHGHMSWIDATAQAALSARILAEMAEAVDRGDEVEDLRAESELLFAYINESMWDGAAGFYVDRLRDTSLSSTRTIGAYWTLLAGLVPETRLRDTIGHLESSRTFNRPHRVPSLAADHSKYDPAGGYWLGGVWAPTNYMVLRALSRAGYDDLAHEIAGNHHRHVVTTFEQTGTIWENYAPESAAPGHPAKADFVGWGGLTPISMLIEYVFGISADVPNNTLIWDVRLTEAHGITNLPFGPHGLVDLRAEARRSDTEPPVVEVASDVPLEIEVRWDGGSKSGSAVSVSSR